MGIQIEVSFVCFKGGMGDRVYPGSPIRPLCLTGMSVFAEIPKVVSSLCTIENSAIGTWTIRETSGTWYGKIKVLFDFKKVFFVFCSLDFEIK